MSFFKTECFQKRFIIQDVQSLPANNVSVEIKRSLCVLKFNNDGIPPSRRRIRKRKLKKTV